MREVERAHQKLREFKSELADVTINYDINFETEGFAKFADFFFDSLIADWYMQSKINNSYQSVENVKIKSQAPYINCSRWKAGKNNI